MSPHLRWSSTVLTVLAGLVLSWSALGARGAGARLSVAEPLAKAEIFVELNDTDHDLGLHGDIDGGAWTRLTVEGPRDRTLLDIFGAGKLRSQGLTQLAFESAEPPFEELDPAEFFGRFPEGRYEIEAVRQGGGLLMGTARLSHVLAAPAVATVSGVAAAENCDAPSLPHVGGPVLIDWEPVTTSHPDVGRPGPVTISRYQFFVEQGDMKLSLDLPPSVTEFEIPASITATGGRFKFEIIARTSTGNNTAIESCFVVP
jgi:hypothetical protein